MINCDLLLIHPPAFFDFRTRMSTLYWPFFSSGGSEPITPLYENFPIGFLSIKDVLERNNFKVEIVNVSTLILQNRDIDLEEYFSNFNAKLIGIDLHWMVHVHGALKMAEFFKEKFNHTPIIFGGISSTYYAEELIEQDYIDMVMRGYDTHEPLLNLMKIIDTTSDFSNIPNLLWKNKDKKVFCNEFSHLPENGGCGINLNSIPSSSGGILDFKDVLTVENYGCAHNCGWCGGSRDAFKRINGLSNKSVISKSIDSLEYELITLKNRIKDGSYNIYSLGTYSESSNRVIEFLKVVDKYPIKNLMIDQFNLTSDQLLDEMAAIKPNVTINLSPQSHDIEISKLSGRGTYSMEKMEEWIEKALSKGITSIDVYFFIGMPKQDLESVRETVKYIRHLLTKFKGQKVNSVICPMMPFLDPGCNYFEDPDFYGYKLFHKTLIEHKKAMENISYVNRLNYETNWLTREEIVDVSYEAIIDVFKIKAHIGMLSNSLVNPIIKKLEEARSIIKYIHINQDNTHLIENEEIQKLIYDSNNHLFFGENNRSTVLNQSFPVKRKIGSRWFDIIPNSDL